MISKPDIMKVADVARSLGYTVHAPVEQEAGILLGRLDDASGIHLEHVLTINTLKDVMLPRVEILADFDVERQQVKPRQDDTGKFLVVGSRPCDAAALEILDAILGGPLGDTRYVRRRQQGVVMTVACSRADQACFCTSMGYGPHDATGSDILLLPSQGRFLVRSLSPKGERFLEEAGIEQDQSGEPDPPPQLKRTVATAGLKTWLDRNFESPKWLTVSENCVGCGTCYYLCPTCHCYDITDEAGLSRGQRLRVWDSCSFSGFTRMAGHQPRVGRAARYRQRIMHKFKYCPDNINKVACVGDGRCLRFCPYGVDMGEILEKLLQKG